jgi:DNA-binding PadR family transcriptional regulator
MRMSGAHRDAWRNVGETFRPRNLLQPCLLILLEEAAGYGYEMNHRLDQMMGGPPDMPAVYRALKGLEEGGLLASHWERSAAGPERRCYSITAEGREVMAGWAGDLAQIHTLLGGVLRRYEEVAPVPAHA